MLMWFWILVGHVGFHQAIEFDQWLVVEDYPMDVADIHARLIKAVANRVPGKPGVVLLARKAFFLRSGDNLTILYECGGTIVIVSRNSQNVHS